MQHLSRYLGEQVDWINFKRPRHIKQNQNIDALMAALDFTDVALGLADPFSQQALVQSRALAGLPNDPGDDPPFVRICCSRHSTGLMVPCLYSILEYNYA